MTTTTLEPSIAGVPGPDAYLQAWRPWLALYGLRVKPTVVNRIQVELAQIQKLLPEELLHIVFSKMSAYTLGAAQCVCTQWRRVGSHQQLWQAACSEAFANSSFDENCQLVRRLYRRSWKTMFLERPHIRFDGVYVSRNIYMRTGIVEWKVKNAVHWVCYFRYYRFLPNGTFLYRTSPATVAKVAKSLLAPPRHKPRADGNSETVYSGQYRLKDDATLLTAMVYPNSSSTEIRTRLRLRSTVPGANNRLDVQSIVSFNQRDSTLTPLDLSNDDPEDAVGDGALSHKRGLQPCVFVPWEHVNASLLNLSFDKMDVYIAG